MKNSVLIYDDDPEILEVCKIILDQQDYVVETRAFCDNIIIDTETIKPSIILMDLWIPTIGGEAAIKLVKGNKSSAHIPIILFSANTDISIIAERSNADGFLKKPFEITTLQQLVRDSIELIKR